VTTEHNQIRSDQKTKEREEKEKRIKRVVDDVVLSQDLVLWDVDEELLFKHLPEGKSVLSFGSVRSRRSDD